MPLTKANVDTDVIIRMDRCAEFPRDQLGPWAFESIRFSADGALDHGCIFNNPKYSSATILIASKNFGCGSSREWAVWALAGMGLRCVIAPSFGDIFFANCFQNGLLPIRLPLKTVEALQEKAAGGDLFIEIDLGEQTIAGATSEAIRFEVEPLRRSMLMAGLDEISMTLKHDADITKWREQDITRRAWSYAPFKI